MAKHPGGRPKKYTGEVLEQLIKDIWDYINHTEIPILAEFAYQQEIPRQYLYEIPELSDAIRVLMEKKQSVLEHGALMGDLNSSMAIFSLKQMGWKDKQEIKQELSGEVKLELDYESCRKIAEKLKKE